MHDNDYNNNYAVCVCVCVLLRMSRVEAIPGPPSSQVIMAQTIMTMRCEESSRTVSPGAKVCMIKFLG